MRVLSLFDGISGAQQALKNLGIIPEVYYASEIDKYTISVTMKNFPNTIQLGDVTKINKDMVGEIDLLIGGSPCQGFSFAGKQLNFEDPRSKLFFEFVRILKEVKPKYFLLENVKMRKEYQDIISNELGVAPIEINSALVTAQQRKRLYWTNIPNIPQPEDLKIYLKDIIETGDVDRLKSYCIDASYYKGTNLETYLKKAKRQVVFEGLDFIGGIESERKKWLDDGKELSRNYSQGNRVYSDKGKSSTLSANGGGLGAKTGLYACRVVGRKINKQGKRDDSNPNIKAIQRLEINDNPSKTNCLTTVQKDNYICEDDNKEFVIRKLTPIECERLQTFPDNYTALGIDINGKEVKISNTQRYKALGNSFTVKVIEHILKEVLNDKNN